MKTKDLSMLKETIRMFKWTLIFLTPYIAMLADREAYMERGYYSFGGEMFVPIFCWVCVLILQRLQVKLAREIKKRALIEAISKKVSGNA